MNLLVYFSVHRHDELILTEYVQIYFLGSALSYYTSQPKGIFGNDLNLKDCFQSSFDEDLTQLNWYLPSRT